MNTEPHRIQRMPAPGDKWLGLDNQQCMDILYCLETCFRQAAGHTAKLYDGVQGPIKALMDDLDKELERRREAGITGGLELA